MLGKIKDAVAGVSFEGWLHIIGIAVILMAIGAWKQSVDDHIQNQDRHIVAQDETMRELAVSIKDTDKRFERQNDKLDALKDDVSKVRERMISVEGWIKLDTANHAFSERSRKTAR